MSDKKAKKKVYLMLGAVLFAMLLLEILFARPHHHRLWNVLPGADMVIGFGGAWLLILLGKVILNKLLRRPEDYYMQTEGTEAADSGKTSAENAAPTAQHCEKNLKQKEGGGHV